MAAFTNPFEQNPFMSEEDELARSIIGRLTDPTGAMYNTAPTSPRLDDAIREAGLLQGGESAPPLASGLAQTPALASGHSGVSAGGEGPQWQQKLRQFMSSPGYAQARQAMANRADREMWRPVQGGTPTQAYQRSLMANEQLLQQKQQQQQLAEYRADQMKTSALNRQVAERGMDPAADYNDLVEQGLIDPAEMSYADFMTMSTKGTIPSNVREWKYYSGLGEADQQKYLEMKRAAQLFGGGGGTTMERTPGGGSRRIGMSPEEIARLDAEQEGAKTSAVEGVKTNAEQVRAGISGAQDARLAYQSAESMLNVTNEWAAAWTGAG
jgi:hypothetical protein